MISTGLKGLDEIITGLKAGDNVVWQIDDVDDYKVFVTPFVDAARASGKKVIYMRFASHPPLLKDDGKIKTCKLEAHSGFEPFSREVNNIITKEGKGACYVFDCLSDLLSAWATDLMIGNFFMVTCPYLYEMDTIAYFSILRKNHSYKTVARIRETTQLLIDVYNCEGDYYIHPLKVWNRYSPTMFLPHVKRGDKLTPITDSVGAAKLFAHICMREAESAKRKLDYWDRLFLEAEELSGSSGKHGKKQQMVDQLCSIMVSRDNKILSLSQNNFTLEDVLRVKSRLIGTGFIGGKAVGMLLARKILSKDDSLEWEEHSEPHDSFYIGSDVFYSYIVQNGWWKLLMEQKTKEGYFEAAVVLKEKMLRGAFPDEVMEKFQQMIEYFGQAPIIVRSSSLLEDGFGNAFAGKYESIFCANQGTPEQRYIQFAEAVRRIYASTMNEDALAYRLQRGLDRLEEQMALLVQRVSGSYHRHYFYPDIGGVGISYNTCVWNKDMDPQAGMLRVVYGLGTRSVNRVEGDYPRIVALDKPLLRPHSGMEDLRRFSQHEIDLIDVNRNALETVPLSELKEQQPDLDLEPMAVRDEESTRKLKEIGSGRKESWVLTFDKIFAKGPLKEAMSKILKILEKSYDYPVDIEFTVNFTEKGDFQVNLLQCRPLQTKISDKKFKIPEDISRERTLFESEGYFFGGNVSQPINRIIHIDPAAYTALRISEKYDIARIVGKLNRQISDREKTPTLLLGPGRWGTTTPSLGVPVTFSEINNIAVLGEIAFSGGNLMPELSFGTHFFQDLVETDIFYVAIFPEREDVFYNEEGILSLRDIFPELMPDHGKYGNVVRVFDVSDKDLRVMSDIVSQRIICYSESPRL